MDSKLVVEQMAGRWKIKHADMRRLALRGPRRGGADQRGRRVGVVHAGSRGSATRTPTRCPTTAWTAGPSTGCWRDARSVGRRGRRRRRRRRSPRRRSSRRSIDPAPSPTTAGPWHAARPPASSWCGTASPTSPSPRGSTVAAAPTPPSTPPGRAQAAAAGRAVAHLLGGAAGAGGDVRPGPGPADRGGGGGGHRRPSRRSTTDWDEQDFGDWDGASIPTWCVTSPDALAALRGDPAYARPGGESHRAWSTRVLAAYRAGRRRGRHDRRRLPPQADHVRARRTCWASRTTRCGGWPRPPGR